MKVYLNVKPIYDEYKVIRRRGRAMAICENPCHRQHQGQSRSET